MTWSDHDQRQQRAEDSLRECLVNVIAKLNEKKEHLPPANLNTTVPMVFNYEVIFAVTRAVPPVNEC